MKSSMADIYTTNGETTIMNLHLLAERLFPDIHATPADMEERFPPRQLPEEAVVTRMAPSPTGFVHLGNLVQGLTAERLAHQSGGVLFLRIEDTDSKREVPGAVETLISSLAYYDIRFDEGAAVDGDIGFYGPYRQRQRKEIYHVYAKKLVEEGKAYPCFCSEEELAAIHAEQEAEKTNFGYYGRWARYRDASFETICEKLDAGVPWVLRFRSDGSIANKIRFTDLIKGTLELTENDIDHVLLKSDGIPTYHFAHAVDDHLMHTTHVVRGDEWLPSLPFHLQLFSALGWKPPKYLHIGPLMKMDGASKRKLSKRKDPELALSFYQKLGYPAEAVYEYLLTVLNSNYEDWRRANPTADAETFKFSYKKMNPAGSLFDADKLRDVSREVISRMSAERVFSLAKEWAGIYDPDFYEKLTVDPAYAIAILAIGRGGKKPRKDLAVFSELKEYMAFFYDGYFCMEADMPAFSPADMRGILTDYARMYTEADDQDAWFEKIRSLSEKYGFCSDTKLYKTNPGAYKGHVGDVSMILRVAVTGRRNSPDMFEVMRILGRERVAARLADAEKKI